MEKGLNMAGQSPVMSKDSFHLIITGGTIDSCFIGKVPPKTSKIPGYLLGLKNQLGFIFTKVCMKDSRNLTEADLKAVLLTVKVSKSKKIIITHGTYTMVNTAKYLKKNLAQNEKTVILTGSLIPLGLNDSDAPSNIGYSISKSGELAPGVYVCMNGETFEPDNVMKQKNGKFVKVTKEKKRPHREFQTPVN